MKIIFLNFLSIIFQFLIFFYLPKPTSNVTIFTFVGLQFSLTPTVHEDQFQHLENKTTFYVVTVHPTNSEISWKYWNFDIYKDHILPINFVGIQKFSQNQYCHQTNQSKLQHFLQLLDQNAKLNRQLSNQSNYNCNFFN